MGLFTDELKALMTEKTDITLSDWSRILGVEEVWFKFWFEGVSPVSAEYLRLIIATVEQRSDGKMALASFREMAKKPINEISIYAFGPKIPGVYWEVITLNHYLMRPIIEGFLGRLSTLPPEKQLEVMERSVEIMQKVCDSKE